VRRILGVLAAAGMLLAVTSPAMAATRPANYPTVGDVDWLRVASNTSIYLGLNSTNELEGTSEANSNFWMILAGGVSPDYMLEEYGTGLCAFYDSSAPPFYHVATCNTNSLYDIFAPLTNNTYSEQENLGTEDCFYSDGLDGRIENKACAGDNDADRWEAFPAP
jgi:hypothetical protein